MKTHETISTALRVFLKTSLLFVIANVIYAATNPLPALSQVTLHNWLIPGRTRLQAANAGVHDLGYGRATTNIDLMLATHEIAAAPKAVDEFRVLLLGDSSTWGYLLDETETISENINRQNLVTSEGQRVRVYNLSLPGMHATKDLLLMARMNQFEPDLVVWFVSLESFRQAAQRESFFVCSNMVELRPILTRYNIAAAGCQFEPPVSLLSRTIWGQRRDLATLLSSQIDGLLWAATSIDHHVVKRTTLIRQLNGDTDWMGNRGPILHDDLLIMNAMDAAKGLVGAPLLVVNEPILALNGINTNQRYNQYLPRWAYDQYMEILEVRAQQLGVRYANFWDAVTADQFTDNEVHYTAKAARELADRLGQEILYIQNANASHSQTHLAQ